MPATALQPLDTVEVLLVRHGQTAWNLERRFLGRSDIPLDSLGLRQAAAVGARLSSPTPKAIYSSPLSRALDTARAIGPVLPIAGLAEMDMGELEGLSMTEGLTRFPGVLARWRDDPGGVDIPGGENLTQVQARIVAAFGEILRRHVAGDRIVVVTHQLALASLLCALSDRPLSDFRAFGHQNGGFTTLRAGSSVEIVRVDEGEHLDLDPTAGQEHS